MVVRDDQILDEKHVVNPGVAWLWTIVLVMCCNYLVDVDVSLELMPIADATARTVSKVVFGLMGVAVVFSANYLFFKGNDNIGQAAVTLLAIAGLLIGGSAVWQRDAAKSVQVEAVINSETLSDILKNVE